MSVIRKCEWCGHNFISIDHRIVCSANCSDALYEYQNAPKNLERLYQEQPTQQAELHESFNEIMGEVFKQEQIWRERYA